MKPPRSEKGFALIIIIILVIIGGIVAYFVFQKPSSLRSLIPLEQSSGSTDTLFGTMLAFSAKNPLTAGGNQEGWTEFKRDNSAYQSFLSDFKKTIQDHTKLVKETGFSLDRELVPYFTWNVIEPQKGQFNWDLTDIYVQAASSADVKISAVIQPFTSWDQKNPQIDSNCKSLDFAYYDYYKVGPPNDIAEYKNFLTKTVERYKDSVAVWEIGNEPGSPCGGYQNNPQGYFDLVKTSSETIKKADPQAIVLNGAASEFSENNGERSFWTIFLGLGGGKYLDKFNLHYNLEKSGAKSDSSVFLADLTSYNDLLSKNGGTKPIWITEFGTYSGTPTNQNQPAPAQGQPRSPAEGPTKMNPQGTPPAGQKPGSQNSVLSATSQNFPTQSPEFQAAWYFRYSILAFANNTESIFPDFVGPNDSPIGASAMFDTSGQPRLFLTTLKMVDSKISSFSKAEKITDDQYKFTVGGKTIYALWSGTLPNEISGKVKVTDIKGQEQTTDVTSVKLNVDQPIFLEAR